MIMKAALITIKEISVNYGNSLQNYAAKKVLEDLGCEVDTLVFTYNRIGLIKNRVKYLLYNTVAHRPEKRLNWGIRPLKINRFQEFHKKFCPPTYIKRLENLNTKYDFFVIGSDQVWNPNWYYTHPLKKDMFLLTFARPEQKVCMAPSFGVAELPPEWNDFFGQELKKFPNLAVREQTGIDLIRKLTGKNAELVIDPTLMLDKEDWNKIVQRPANIDFSQGYILTYFLGELSKERKIYIENLAKEYSLRIYHVLDPENLNLFLMNPGELLYMIANAKLILTDSFHACVFSFIYEKPFLVFQREKDEPGMFSRLETLLNMFQLERKAFISKNRTDIFENDYSTGKIVLQKERKKAVSFLQKSMQLKEK